MPFLVAPGASQPAQSAPDPTAVKQQVIAGLVKFRATFSNSDLHFKGVTRSTERQGDSASPRQVVSPITFECKRKGTYYLLLQSYESEGHGRRFSGIQGSGNNRAYGFSILNNNNRDWLIKGIDIPAKGLDTANLDDFRIETDSYLDLGHIYDMIVRKIDPADVFDLPGFTLQAAGPEGTNRFRIDFRYEHKHPTKEIRFPVKSYMTFATDDNWFPVAFGHASGTDRVITCDRELRRDGHHGSYKHTINISSRYPDPRQPSKIIQESKAIVCEMALNTAELPESDFTLTAFGLPEPPGVDWRSRGVPRYLWALAAGIGCLGVYIALRRRAARATA